jgi:hypothetical protein
VCKDDNLPPSSADVLLLPKQLLLHDAICTVIKPELRQISQFCLCDVYCFDVNLWLMTVQISLCSDSCFARSKPESGTNLSRKRGVFDLNQCDGKRPKRM